MIRPLPPAPSRDNPGPFAAQSDALLAALAGFVDDCNALEQSLIFVGTTGQSSTSLSVGSGPKTLTASTGKAWVIGAWVHMVSAGGIGNVMVGQVQAYDVDTGALQVNVGAFAGSGTYSDWLIGLSSPQAPITSALIANGALADKVGAEGGLFLPGDADAPLKAVPKQQAESIATSAATSAVANRMQYSLTASQATTSGSAVDFVGIPSWAKRITVILNGVSINGSEGVSLLLRTAAGPVSSGYETISAYIPNGTPATATSGAQLLSCGAVAATEVSGVWTLNNFGGNTWVAHGGVYRKNDAGFQSSAGRITLADVVTGVRLQTVAAFDAGSVSLLIEG